VCLEDGVDDQDSDDGGSTFDVEVADAARLLLHRVFGSGSVARRTVGNYTRSVRARDDFSHIENRIIHYAQFLRLYRVRTARVIVTWADLYTRRLMTKRISLCYTPHVVESRNVIGRQ